MEAAAFSLAHGGGSSESDCAQEGMFSSDSVFLARKCTLRDDDDEILKNITGYELLRVELVWTFESRGELQEQRDRAAAMEISFSHCFLS